MEFGGRQYEGENAGGFSECSVKVERGERRCHGCVGGGGRFALALDFSISMTESYIRTGGSAIDTLANDQPEVDQEIDQGREMFDSDRPHTAFVT